MINNYFAVIYRFNLSLRDSGRFESEIHHRTSPVYQALSKRDTKALCMRQDYSQGS
jgi:hypothetical protein